MAAGLREKALGGAAGTCRKREMGLVLPKSSAWKENMGHHSVSKRIVQGGAIIAAPETWNGSLTLKE
jgi:hypothetical protein